MKKYIPIVLACALILLFSWILARAGVLYNIDPQNNGVMANCPNGQVMMASSSAASGLMCVDPATVMPGNNNYEGYGSGAAYSLTATPAQVVMGTTNPSITLASAGTYLIYSRARIDYNVATFLASRTVSLKLRRTNNTAADLANAAAAMKTQIVTLLSSTSGDVELPPVVYTTTSTSDIIQLFGSISVVPTAGSMDIGESEIVAVRIY